MGYFIFWITTCPLLRKRNWLHCREICPFYTFAITNVCNNLIMFLAFWNLNFGTRLLYLDYKYVSFVMLMNREQTQSLNIEEYLFLSELDWKFECFNNVVIIIYCRHIRFLNKRPIGLNWNLRTIAHTKFVKKSYVCIGKL